MNERLQALLEDIDRGENLAGPNWRRYLKHAAWLAESAPQERMKFLDAVAHRTQPLTPRAEMLLAEACRQVVIAESRSTLPSGARPASASHAPGESALSVPPPAESPVNVFQTLYAKLDASSPVRVWLLAWLATSGGPAEIAALVELLVTAPPTGEQEVVQSFAPLFQRLARAGAPGDSEWLLATLFPRLLDAVSHLQLAASVLDLANFATREKLLAVHPAADRASQLIALLGELAQSLAMLEESPDRAGLAPVELSRRVAQHVALAVSLCDALALIGEKGAIGKLHQALALRHRRLRTEAAAALARLGDATGADELVALAAEPVARLRVLAYAKELGLEERIEPEFRTPLARAESELTVYLAEPTQYGIPPTAMELFDRRRQHWPGYVEPVDCYLFRFTYAVTLESGEKSFSNIGIAGPLTHAFVADLGDLPAADIYAAYAGWQAEHPEIQQFDVQHLSRSEQLEVERFARRLKDAGFTGIEPTFMGYFFGTKALVAQALRGETAGIAIADQEEEVFFPKRRSARPLEARECYCIYKGRKLLASFNPSGQAEREG